MERPRSLLRISRHAHPAHAQPSVTRRLKIIRARIRNAWKDEQGIDGSFVHGTKIQKGSRFGKRAFVGDARERWWNVREKRRKGEGETGGRRRRTCATSRGPENWPASRRRFDHASFLFLRSFLTRPLSRTSAVNRFFLSRLVAKNEEKRGNRPRAPTSSSPLLGKYFFFFTLRKYTLFENKLSFLITFLLSSVL